MGAIASQITSLTIVYSTVYSDADQRKHQSSASLAFVLGIHRGPVTRKVFPFDYIIMPHNKQGKSEGFDSCDRPSNLKLDTNRQFFRPCDHEIWWMTSKNNRALLLYYIKLCASFQIHWWIQTGFTQKRSIRVENGYMLSRVTLKFDGWPWKTIRHLFYATSSFVQHFVAIGEFKLELQSGNGQSGSNSTIFRAVRPWNLTDDLAKQ